MSYMAPPLQYELLWIMFLESLEELFALDFFFVLNSILA